MKESPGPERVDPGVEAFLFSVLFTLFTDTVDLAITGNTSIGGHLESVCVAKTAPRSESKAVGVSLGYLYRCIKAVY